MRYAVQYNTDDRNTGRECISLRCEASDIEGIRVYEVRIGVSYAFVLPSANVVQPPISYAEAHNVPLGDMGNLNPDGDKLGTSAVPLSTVHKLWEIDRKVPIVVFGG